MKDGRDAFEEVSIKRVLEMLSPCEIWMDGSSLWPLRLGDTENLLWEPSDAFDLRIFVNGKRIFENAKMHLAAMVLLAWARLAARGDDDDARTISAKDVCEYVHRRFYKERQEPEELVENLQDFREKYQNAISTYLDRLVEQIRDAGGLVERIVGQHGVHYGMIAKPLPYFLRES